MTDEIETGFRQWLAGMFPPYPLVEPKFHIGSNYFDIVKLTGQFVGPLAISFNRVLLVNERLRFPADNLPEMAKKIGNELGYEVIELPSRKMLDLRAPLREDQPPHFQQGKEFRRSLGKYADRFPALDHTDPIINRARVQNAFKFRGLMTHVLVWSRDGDGERFTIEWYPSADEALLALMKREKTDNFKLMEIGQ